MIESSEFLKISFNAKTLDPPDSEVQNSKIAWKDKRELIFTIIERPFTQIWRMVFGLKSVNFLLNVTSTTFQGNPSGVFK